VIIGIGIGIARPNPYLNEYSKLEDDQWWEYPTVMHYAPQLSAAIRVSVAICLCYSKMLIIANQIIVCIDW
jgi:hypothetical protein